LPSVAQMDLESSLVWLNGRLDSAVGGAPNEVALLTALLVAAFLFLAWASAERRIRHLKVSIGRLELELTIAREALALEESCRIIGESAPLIEERPKTGVKTLLRLISNDKSDVGDMPNLGSPPKAS
jgi:hypothetical protein